MATDPLIESNLILKYFAFMSAIFIVMSFCEVFVTYSLNGPSRMFFPLAKLKI